MITTQPYLGVYGSVGETPSQFQVNSANAILPGTEPRNSSDANPERITWPVAYPFRWGDDKPFHRFQPQNALIFRVGRWKHPQPRDIIKLATLDQVNRMCYNAWENFRTDSARPLAPGNPNEKRLVDFTTSYMTEGQDLYYNRQDWEDCSAFDQHILLSRFLWLSHKSIEHTVRCFGPKLIIGTEALVPNLSCTTVVAGHGKVSNYWGQVRAGDRLYLIIKQSGKGKGPFQLQPWFGIRAPCSAELKYTDNLGLTRFGAFIFIGTVDRRPESYPQEQERLISAGLEPASMDKTFKMLSSLPTVDVAFALGDPRA